MTAHEKHDVETSSGHDIAHAPSAAGNGLALKPTVLERERAEALARLPDPDAGKSDEERAEIVSVQPYTLSSYACP